jgi:hypothetical protein
MIFRSSLLPRREQSKGMVIGKGKTPNAEVVAPNWLLFGRPIEQVNDCAMTTHFPGWPDYSRPPKKLNTARSGESIFLRPDFSFVLTQPGSLSDRSARLLIAPLLFAPNCPRLINECFAIAWVSPSECIPRDHEVRALLALPDTLRQICLLP